MSRKGITTRERPSNDIRYTDHPQEMNRNIHKFICGIMNDGKKSIAEKIVFGAFDLSSERTKDDPVMVFEKAVANVLPRLEVRSRRVGGSNYQVPVEVRPERGMALAYRWLIGFARSRPGEDHARAPRQRDARRLAETWRRREEARRHPQDGRRQQGVRPLPLVIKTSRHR